MRLNGFRGLLALMLTATLALALFWPGAARAQQGVFIQIESHASLTEAESRARAYAQLVPNVNAFRAQTGLYAVSLGPYAPADAQTLLSQLLAQGLVPRDSFVVTGTPYVAQVYPIGANALAAPAQPVTGGAEAPVIEQTALPDASAQPGTAPVLTAPEATIVLAPEEPEETLQQARNSEAQLDRAGRDALQIALQWFGFYNSAIDGAFGPGTRNAMSAWQQDRGLDPTGVLTTRQREQLLGEYQGELASLGMQTIRDERAGIQIDLPLAMVRQGDYNFPFAQFDQINDSAVQILLISQPGDRNTLFGLYEIMQTLEIVPLEGARERQGDRFVLTGQSDTLRSHTEARLVGGAVKGFTLVWPPERDDQIARVLPMMQQSFTALDGALDPGAIPAGLEENIDMVSGLEVRQPDLVRSGFYIDAQGSVLTTTEAVAGQCAQVLIDNAYEAEVSYRDDALGLAVLRPRQRLAPMAFAEMASSPGRLRSDVGVAGFPFDGALSSASMAFGTLADLRGMNGEETIQRLALDTADSEAGGPVFDLTGTVVGMVLPGATEARALPADVTLALRADQLGAALAAAGLTPTISTRTTTMSRERLARLGADMTVTVTCWN
ncbi:serine protease [Roseicyclus mahoneyensis]|uniref:Putative peptidoglycan binding protein n=1 Tax=Roseicyclus mahoneyensis TaxID=164332 RepID=A0A316GZC1_9RHOB|nr:serine protease [Roseicyclus mahoneyensis]PWK60489.1 putative peptidoglycan binding protein [Roseicyclus mahoneyensis]